MKNFKIFYLLIALSTIMSCTDDLNVVSEDPRTTTPEALFSSFAGYKQALACQSEHYTKDKPLQFTYVNWIN